MKKENLLLRIRCTICLLLCLAMVLPIVGCKAEVKEEAPVTDEEPVISQEDEDKQDNEEPLISQENKQIDEITTIDENLPVDETQNEISLSSDEQYEINIFLSNFSEQWFYEHKTEDFEVNSADIAELIRFVFIYRKINGPNSFWDIVDENDYVYLSFDDVNNTLNRFFGISITLNDAQNSGYIVKNNRIYDVYGIGESYNNFTIADSVTDQNDGTYLVSFNIYELDLESYFADGIGKDYYYLDSNSAENRTDLSFHLSGKAVVKPYTTSIGRNTYQLISYTLEYNIDTDYSNMNEFTKESSETQTQPILPAYQPTVISEQELSGNWTIDAEYTMDYNNTSMTSMFGSSYKYGCGMEYGSDNYFDYYIAAGIGGKGSYWLENDLIHIDIIEYEDGNPENFTINVTTEDGITRLAMKVYNYLIFWVKC